MAHFVNSTCLVVVTLWSAWGISSQIGEKELAPAWPSTQALVRLPADEALVMRLSGTQFGPETAPNSITISAGIVSTRGAKGLKITNASTADQGPWLEPWLFDMTATLSSRQGVFLACTASPGVRSIALWEGGAPYSGSVEALVLDLKRILFQGVMIENLNGIVSLESARAEKSSGLAQREARLQIAGAIRTADSATPEFFEFGGQLYMAGSSMRVGRPFSILDQVTWITPLGHELRYDMASIVVRGITEGTSPRVIHDNGDVVMAVLETAPYRASPLTKLPVSLSVHFLRTGDLATWTVDSAMSGAVRASEDYCLGIHRGGLWLATGAESPNQILLYSFANHSKKWTERRRFSVAQTSPRCDLELGRPRLVFLSSEAESDEFPRLAYPSCEGEFELVKVE